MNNPTKEELKRDWESNRAHFDALAKFYYVNDREYYDKYIKPFYDRRESFTKKSSGPRNALLILLGISIMLISGISVLIFTLTKNIEKTIDEGIKEMVIDSISTYYNGDTVIKLDKFKTPYFKALKLMSKKDYEEAEEILRQIPEDDPDYKNSQKLLESIKYLKKYDKK